MPKPITLRLPASLESAIRRNAAERGISVSAHIRHLIERETHTDQLALLRSELLAKFAERPPTPSVAPMPLLAEILLLSRAIATHCNPQLVTQVRTKLTQKRSTQS